MRLHLDSSALVKLAIDEAETPALHQYLDQHSGDELASSALARTEVVRAVLGEGAERLADVRSLLARVYLRAVDTSILDAAAVLPTTPMLRSLDAIHAASAQRLGLELRALISYDTRMIAAAEALGLPVVSPA